MQYGVQLYTLRALPAGERVPPVAAAGFDGVELVGLDAVDADGLSTVAAHVDHATLEADPGDAVERCRANGTETVVVPILDDAAFDWNAIDATADRLDRLAADVAAAGGRLLYHNHEFEFERDPASGTDAGGGTAHGTETSGGETPFDRLVGETTRLGFELDVGWATAAGVDPIALIERLGDRLPIVHLKDVRIDPTAPRGGHPVDLGNGDVDLRGCLRAAEATDVEWVVFEHDAPTEPERSVRDAATWLRDESSGSR